MKCFLLLGSFSLFSDERRQQEASVDNVAVWFSASPRTARLLLLRPKFVFARALRSWERPAEGSEEVRRLPRRPASWRDRREQRRRGHFLVAPLPGRSGAHPGRLQPAAQAAHREGEPSTSATPRLRCGWVTVLLKHFLFSFFSGGLFKIQKLHHPRVSDKRLEVPERVVRQGGVFCHLPSGRGDPHRLFVCSEGSEVGGDVFKGKNREHVQYTPLKQTFTLQTDCKRN